MEDTRRNRDFSKGPVRHLETNRWHVEVRYPNGSRLRKRFRREREALRFWSSEQAKIENGTRHDQAPKTVTLGTAFSQYREYSKVQNRSHRSYVEPVLTMWETQLGANRLLAKITPAHIDDIKLRRTQEVARSTADKDLAVLKSFSTGAPRATWPHRTRSVASSFSTTTTRACGTSPPKSTSACSAQPGKSKRHRCWPKRSRSRRTRACAEAACSTCGGTRSIS